MKWGVAVQPAARCAETKERAGFGDAGTPYQKPVGIDAKRGTCDQSADIFPFRNT